MFLLCVSIVRFFIAILCGISFKPWLPLCISFRVARFAGVSLWHCPGAPEEAGITVAIGELHCDVRFLGALLLWLPKLANLRSRVLRAFGLEFSQFFVSLVFLVALFLFVAAF